MYFSHLFVPLSLDLINNNGREFRHTPTATREQGQGLRGGTATAALRGLLGTGQSGGQPAHLRQGGPPACRGAGPRAATWPSRIG